MATTKKTTKKSTSAPIGELIFTELTDDDYKAFAKHAKKWDTPEYHEEMRAIFQKYTRDPKLCKYKNGYRSPFVAKIDLKDLETFIDAVAFIYADEADVTLNKDGKTATVRSQGYQCW